MRLSPTALSILLLSAISIVLARSDSPPTVLDAHVHSVLDYTRISYTYPPDNIFYANWTYEDYHKATRVSLIQPTEYMFVSVTGLPADQYLAQCLLAQEQAVAVAKKGASPRMAGIISSADVEKPDFASFLDKLVAKVPLVRGVRSCYHPGSFPPSYVDGLRQLAQRNLTMEILLAYQEQLGDIYDVVRQVPEVTFIVIHFGHMGGPHQPTPEFSWWAPIMERLATLPNVHVKISGATALLPQDPLKLYLPYFRFVIEHFGYDRCIFSGNWPVVTAQEGFWGYRGWAAAVDYFLTEVNASYVQRQALLYETGRHAYRLGTVPPVVQI